MELIAHPDWPANGVRAVEVDIVMTDADEMDLRFRVRGSGELSLPQWLAPARGNDLWKTTCFEMFVKPEGGDGYVEFNLAPSCAWAAYAFDGYRDGKRDFDPAREPVIERYPQLEPGEDGLIYALSADVDLGGIPPGPLRVGLSAVIEEADGTMSYWALAHPPGKADFHAAACFALRM